MIIARAPFRISFFGGGTDFPDFYREHGGATLSTTINQYCYVSIHQLSPFFKYQFKASYSNTECVRHPREFEHPLIRESLLFLKITQGLELVHVSDLPGRTGLGTSSAFTVGLLHALHTMLGHAVTPEDLAREAIHVERVRVGDAGGHQDQYAAAYGGFLRLNYSGRQQIEIKRIALPSRRLRELQDRLLVFYMGVEQSAEELLREQKKSIKKNVHALQEMRQMVDEAERILSGRGDLRDFGDLLHESWQRKKSLSSGIANGMINDAYAAALKAGARGGKVLGAGGRGFLLVFAEPKDHPAIRKKLGRLKEVTFGFSQAGSQIIFKHSEE